MAEVLTLEHVNKAFGKRPVVQDVSFSVREGEVFGFLGPNGAGKTTTIKMILGLLSPDSGTICVAGHNVETDFEAAMRHISGIVENPDMYPYLSGYDNLRIQARACGIDEKEIDEAVTMVGMQLRIKEKFKTYSLGMKQRIGVAQALLRKPKIMILDEPTNGLDPAGIREFRDLLRGLAHTYGMSVLVSSHILQEMQLMCDTVGIINGGHLVQVSPMEELAQQDDFQLVRFVVRPMETAAALLQTNAADRVTDVAAEHIDLRLKTEEIPLISRRLIENGVALYGVSVVGTSLEERFLHITGGGTIVG